MNVAGFQDSSSPATLGGSTVQESVADGAETKRLNSLVRRGTLVLPSSRRPNLVDLSNALARWGGAHRGGISAGVQRIGRLLHDPEHLVFVLIDGLGSVS
ncbi:MAG: hypothetical protein AAB289_12175, partial [Chloroflexota bacterium]